jgi:cytochrome c553
MTATLRNDRRRLSLAWTAPQRAISSAFAIVALAALAGHVPGAESVADSLDRESLFESHVRPLLVEKCQRCHGNAVAEAGLRLDSRRAVLAGGDSGPAVFPGDAEKSPLLAAVRHAGDVEMPPDGKLSDDEIAVLETWVTAGMPWSGPGGESEASPDSRSPDMATRLAEARGSHWAFRAPTRHPAPEVSPTLEDAIRTTWNRSPIDRFIAARLTAEGLAPAADATPRELVRRLWFDLTGLPPPAAEVERFCAIAARDGSVDPVFAATLERLLATPEHAEHWARKWLDLARYADTIGYALGVEKRHPFAWVYRDWVVDSLAADMPYDRFVTLQLAADLVEPPVDRRDLAALGFLTVGRTFKGSEHDIIDDCIDLVTRGLMGLTVSCARCHDHKYEPVGTADYYALHGIFASCRMPEELPMIADATPGPEADAFQAKLRSVREAVAKQEATVHARATREAIAHAADYFMETARPTPRGEGKQTPRLADGYLLEQLLLDRFDRLVNRLDREDPHHPVLGPWLAARGSKDDEVATRLEAFVAVDGGRPINAIVRAEILSTKPDSLRELAEAYARVLSRAAPEWAGGPAPSADDPPELLAVRSSLGTEGTPLVVPAGDAMRLANRLERDEQNKLRRAVTAHFIDSPGGPRLAPAVCDGTPTDSRVLIRGNPGRPGPTIERRLPLLLGGTPVARTASGRLELARAIVSPDNPLAPRLIVNWAWTHHMGSGLVTTPDDLGLRGDAPSHQDLLDDLSRRFVEEGRWSLRWLHREIVSSRTWRQSSEPRDELATIDPDNRLMARANRRRLEWEAWRDSLLTAAGSLDLARRGGPGVDPLAIDAMDRRSLYAWVDRQDVPGMLRAFDVANPDTAVLRRTPTTTPQQSLAVLNSPLVVEAARRVAARIEREADGDAERVEALWKAVLSRDPSADERRLAREWLAAESADPEARPDGGAEQAGPPRGFGRWARMAQAVLATAEFHFVD